MEKIAHPIPKVTIFEATVAIAYEAALTAYPAERDRIKRGALIALEPFGVVEHGVNASVLGSTGTRYTVNGSCECEDRAPGNRCKHRYSVSLYRYAQRQLKAMLTPEHQWVADVGGTSGVLHAQKIVIDPDGQSRPDPWGYLVFIPYGTDRGQFVSIDEVALGASLVAFTPDATGCGCTDGHVCPGHHDIAMWTHYRQDYPDVA